MSCILCKKSKPAQLFSKSQQKKKKPICLDCTPRRVADAQKKRIQLQQHVSVVNDILSGKNKYMFAKDTTDHSPWKLFFYSDKYLSRRVPFFFQALAGVNNVKNAMVNYRPDDDNLWEVTVGKEKIVRNFWKWPQGAPDIIADFAVVDEMSVYSLKGVLDNLTITFILSPSGMYDVREKYTLEKARLYLSELFHFKRKHLSNLWWPVQIYLEKFIDCSEALSNDIVSFTGEVLMQCSFSSAELGRLFKPWDTWEADLGVMGDFKKRVTLVETVGKPAETLVESSGKEVTMVGDKEDEIEKNERSEAATSLHAASEMNEKSQTGAETEDIKKTATVGENGIDAPSEDTDNDCDSFEIVESPA